MFHSTLYAESISPVYMSRVGDSSWFEWLDLSLTVRGASLSYTQKNSNREWVLAPADPLSHRPVERPRANFLPWAGAPPLSFSQVKGMFIGRITRGQDLLLPEPLAALYILELLLELFYIRYPISYLRAILFAIPAIPSVRLARVSFRQWASFLREMGSGGAGRGNGNGRAEHRGGDRRGGGKSSRGQDKRSSRDSRGTDRRPRRSSRATSPSSSSGSSSATQDTEVEHAKKILKRHSEQYRSFVKDRKQAKRDTQLRLQGEALAKAMKSNFDAAIEAAKFTSQQFPPPQPEAISSPGGPVQYACAGCGVLMLLSGLERPSHCAACRVPRALPPPPPPAAEYGCSTCGIVMVCTEVRPLHCNVCCTRAGLAPVPGLTVRQAVVPPPAAPAPPPGVPGTVQPVAVVAAVPPADGADGLSQSQCRLLEAELGHHVSLNNGTVQHVLDTVLGAWDVHRDIPRSIDRVIKRHAGRSAKVPRAKRDRVQLFYNTIKGSST